MISGRIDHLLSFFDPPQHAYFQDVKKRLQEQNPGYRLLGQLDPSYFQGRSLIYNRETEEHTDKPDPNVAWTPVLCLGKHTHGTLKFLNATVNYPSGALAYIRGGAIPHSVSFSGGQRIAVAHFTHNDTIKEVQKDAAPVSSLDELKALWTKWKEEHGKQSKKRKTG